MKTSPWTTWQADDYYRDYYGADVKPDEREAIRFQVEFLRNRAHLPSAVEYGCGPTLGRALAASSYVRSLHMADRLERNLAKVRQWASGDPARRRLGCLHPLRAPVRGSGPAHAG